MGGLAVAVAVLGAWAGFTYLVHRDGGIVRWYQLFPARVDSFTREAWLVDIVSLQAGRARSVVKITNLTG